jgi:TetR/AcrR family transcriptional regulator, copper-responsive repressor
MTVSTKFMRIGTKKEKAGRGRPRSFDEGDVLDRVRAVFLEKGFAGASLDDLAAAAGLNRPSLYATFGDKEQLYLHALNRYGTLSLAGMETILTRKGPLELRLGQLYRSAVSLYTGPAKAPGCMIVNTAAVEAPTHPKIAVAAAKLLAEIEASLERAFTRAVAKKEIPALPSPAARARLAAGIFDTLAVRARLGESATELKRFALSMVPALCR